MYKTKDGEYLSVGALENKFWENLCRKLGHPEWIPYQFDEKMWQEIHLSMGKIFLNKNRNEWVAFFEDEEFCCEPILSLKEVFIHPQIIHRQMVQESFHPILSKMIRQLGIPMKFSEIPLQIKAPGPLPGQDTEDVLRGLGYSEKEMEALKVKKVIQVLEARREKVAGQ